MLCTSPPAWPVGELGIWHTAPLTKGQVVGTIDFKLNDKTIEQRPLIVMEAVEEGGFFSRMMDFVLMKFHEWFGGWFS